jgi:hypothetical protein
VTGAAGKNLRLLGLEPSPGRQLDIHEEIALLRQELARGEAVYTAAELRTLERKLVDREEQLRDLTQGG